MAGKIKHYVKSALRQAKADPLFTAIYIAGVTLAIATTLTMAIIYNIKLSPIYPEVNRGNTYFITQLIGENGEAYPRYGQMSYTFAKELRDIEGVKAVGVNGGLGESTITFGEGKPNVKMSSRSVDDGFFKIYEFKFLDGFPFSEEDITGQVKDVIITDEAAKKLFGTTEEIVGKIIPINYSEYRVKGVVESGSRFGNQSYSQLYFPARVAEKEESGTVADRLFGWYVTEMLIEDGSIDSVNEQIINTLRKQADGSGWTFRLQSSRPVSYMQQMLKPYMENFSWWEIIKEKLLLVMVILIVPAVNLSGLISGRMDSRVAEVGLRKAFGANDCDVINMVVSENFVYTLIGGFLGFIIAILAVVCWDTALYNIMTPMEGNYQLHDSIPISFRPEMFASLKLFILIIVISLILNILSAIIPAWVAMRKSIVESINDK